MVFIEDILIYCCEMNVVVYKVQIYFDQCEVLLCYLGDLVLVGNLDVLVVDSEGVCQVLLDGFGGQLGLWLLLLVCVEYMLWVLQMYLLLIDVYGVYWLVGGEVDVDLVYLLLLCVLQVCSGSFEGVDLVYWLWLGGSGVVLVQLVQVGF